MINFISHLPHLFSTIAILFLIGIIIMVYEVGRAIQVPDDYEEEYFLYCWSFMEITRKLISFAVSVHAKVRLRTKPVVSSCSCCRPS